MNSDGTDQKYLAKLVTLLGGNGSECAKYFTHDGNYVIYEQRDIFDINSPEGIYIVDIEGSNPILLSPSDRHPSISPDGLKIACSKREDPGNYALSDLYEMNIDGTEWVRLTDSTSFDQWPIYQPVQR
jgi:Tol biopolymer transport system component